MFNYDKWLKPKIKNETKQPAIFAIPATSTEKNSKNSKNSNLSGFENLNLTALKEFLGENWELCKDNPKALMAWADLLQERQIIEKGEIPENFTATAYCKSCNKIVPIPPAQACNGKVLGCPWCLNTALGLPVPQANRQSIDRLQSVG